MLGQVDKRDPRVDVEELGEYGDVRKRGGGPAGSRREDPAGCGVDRPGQTLVVKAFRVLPRGAADRTLGGAVHDRQASGLESCLLGGPHDSAGGVIGAVHTHHDAAVRKEGCRHATSLVALLAAQYGRRACYAGT